MTSKLLTYLRQYGTIHGLDRCQTVSECGCGTIRKRVYMDFPLLPRDNGKRFYYDPISNSTHMESDEQFEVRLGKGEQTMPKNKKIEQIKYEKFQIVMSCKACGHTHERAFVCGEPAFSQPLLKGKPFIELHVHATISGEDYYSTEKKVQLYACPVCGTIMMDLS